MKPKSHAPEYRYVSPRNIERKNARSRLDATALRSVPPPDPRCPGHAATGASGGSAERRTYSRSGDPGHLRIRSGSPRIPIDFADSILSPSPATVARTWPLIAPSPDPDRLLPGFAAHLIVALPTRSFPCWWLTRPGQGEPARPGSSVVAPGVPAVTKIRSSSPLKKLYMGRGAV
jgi:hypothetical protein